MSRYGLFIGSVSDPELVRFSDEQTLNYKSWITTIKSLITAPDAGFCIVMSGSQRSETPARGC